MSDTSSTYPARRLSIPHLVFGLIFLGISAVWAIGKATVLSSDWVFPAGLLKPLWR